MVIIATALGFIFGAIATVVAGRRFLYLLSKRGANNGVLRLTALTTGLVALLPAAFLAVVGGGTLGGGWGEVVLGSNGIALGMCLGIAVFFAAAIALPVFGITSVVHSALALRRRAAP